MSDYEQSRYARASHPIDTGGASAFWVLVVVVALGALVLILAISGAATAPDASATGSGDSGDTPLVTPAAPEPATTGTTAE